MRDVQVRTVGVDDPVVEEVHRDLLVPGFSPDELVSVDELRSGLDEGSSTMLVASTGSEVLAAAVTEGRFDEDVHLLAYLATRPGHRGNGVGSVLMTALLERWAASDGPALVLAEVHDPATWTATESERPTDRFRFYERFGATRLPFSWVQPRVRPERERVPGMALLVLHARPPALVAPAALDQAIVLRWIDSTQDAAEGPDAGSDLELGAVRAAARATPDPIPLVALAP